MLRVVPFGGFEGFSDVPIVGTHFYSQGFTPTLFGLGTVYSMVQKVTSAGIPGLGPVNAMTKLGGYLYAQDANGEIWKESTIGSYSLSSVRTPGGNGAGMIADQYGNLLYACGSSNNQLGIFDGTTWNDTFQTLSSTQHPMDTYEDLRLVADGFNVGCLFSDGSWNDAAFSIPSQMEITAIKSGPNGILIGAHLNGMGVLILWDGNALRSKVPWKWISGGKILSIDTYGQEWIVKTQRQVLVTNGTTVSELFTVLDDPLSFNNYDSSQIIPHQIALVNDMLVFTITTTSGNNAHFGKMKPGVYLYSFARHAWSYIPIAGVTFDLYVNTVFFDPASNRILISYNTGGNNCIGALVPQSPSQAMFISEQLGLGRIKYQRMYFGPTDKTMEAVVLNLGLLNSMTEAPTVSFRVSLKVYNFKRQLWGHIATSANASTSNQLIVDATVSGAYDAVVGDEVTILEGNNAGYIAHITAIVNDGLSNETWTLDTGLPNNTSSGVNVQVQPFVLVNRQTFTSLSQLKNVFFSVNSIKGKQFLIKVVIDGIATGLSLELLTSYWVFNDLGYSQT